MADDDVDIDHLDFEPEATHWIQPNREASVLAEVCWDLVHGTFMHSEDLHEVVYGFPHSGLVQHAQAADFVELALATEKHLDNLAAWLVAKGVPRFGVWLSLVSCGQMAWVDFDPENYAKTLFPGAS